MSSPRWVKVSALRGLRWTPILMGPTRKRTGVGRTITIGVRSTSPRHKGHDYGVWAAHGALHALLVFLRETLNISTTSMSQNCNTRPKKGTCLEKTWSISAPNARLAPIQGYRAQVARAGEGRKHTKCDFRLVSKF